MPTGTPGRHCSICKRPEAEVGPLSARRKCEGCAAARVRQHQVQMTNKAGPIWESWVAGMVKATEKATGTVVSQHAKRAKRRRSAA